MNRVAAEVSQEVSMLLQNQDVYSCEPFADCPHWRRRADPRESATRSSFGSFLFARQPTRIRPQA